MPQSYNDISKITNKNCIFFIKYCVLSNFIVISINNYYRYYINYYFRFAFDKYFECDIFTFR